MTVQVVISDSSCLIDLRKASLLEAFLRLPYELLIPNTLFEEELLKFRAAQCRVAFDAGRVLLLSPFTGQPKRVTKDSAQRRNEVVAALADDAYVAHVSPGGGTARIAHMLEKWSVPRNTA